MDKMEGKTKCFIHWTDDIIEKVIVSRCDAPNPEGLLRTRQPAEDSWMSGNLIPHH